MRRFNHISLVLAALIPCLMAGGELWAKGGRGGSKGGGKAFKGNTNFRGKGGGNKFGAGPTDHGKHKSSFAADRDAANHHLNDSDAPWSKHQAKELRKLDHRKQVADHLREISDRNGNEHLKQVADDMENRAQAHYDKQMEKIKQKYGVEDAPADPGAPEHVADDPLTGEDDTLNDPGDAVNGTDDSLEPVAGKLTGPENASFRHLRNAERKLAKQMEAVERMREMAEQTGDNSLLEAADELEQQAMDGFHERMEKIIEFRQRHGLPDLTQHAAP